MNEAIALTNIAIAVGLVFAGLAMFWQARRNLWGWPVSAYIALGGLLLGVGVAWLHWAVWRFGDVPGAALDRDGPGTLALRLGVAFVVWAWVRRIVRGHLLTEGDRQRVGRQ